MQIFMRLLGNLRSFVKRRMVRTAVRDEVVYLIKFVLSRLSLLDLYFLEQVFDVVSEPHLMFICCL